MTIKQTQFIKSLENRIIELEKQVIALRAAAAPPPDYEASDDMPSIPTLEQALQAGVSHQRTYKAAPPPIIRRHKAP